MGLSHWHSQATPLGVVQIAEGLVSSGSTPLKDRYQPTAVQREKMTILRSLNQFEFEALCHLNEQCFLSDKLRLSDKPTARAEKLIKDRRK
jgi:hypothetical protein